MGSNLAQTNKKHYHFLVKFSKFLLWIITYYFSFSTFYLACRYDEAEWSDCDPFELIRFRTLRLVAGGRQCEEIKNITKHCTADELPPGTKWLIAEHRKCIAELKR